MFFFFLNLGLELSNIIPELFGGETQSTTSRLGQFSAKYGWYQSIYALSKGDITKYEHITKLKFQECFLMLAFNERQESVRS